MSRLKAPSLQTRAEFDDVVNQIAALEVESRKLAAKRDAKIQSVQEEFEPAETALQEKLSGLLVQAEKYALVHRAVLFPKETKSDETPLARFGFRYGLPTLALLDRRWTWEQVVRILKLSKFKQFIRTVEEVDKEALKKANLPSDDLAAIGVKITQSETFFIEPKLADAEVVRA
jgi:phage host-nuclease inhibitor protein Gam